MIFVQPKVPENQQIKTITGIQGFKTCLNQAFFIKNQANLYKKCAWFLPGFFQFICRKKYFNAVSTNNTEFLKIYKKKTKEILKYFFVPDFFA